MIRQLGKLVKVYRIEEEFKCDNCETHPQRTREVAPSDDCGYCWWIYNKKYNLPIDNNQARSRIKRKPPRLSPQDLFDGQVKRSLKENLKVWLDEDGIEIYFGQERVG